MFGIPQSHEAKQSMNGREADVSCRRSVLAIPFEIREKRQDFWWGQIRQVDFRHGALPERGDKTQKQHKTVAVTLDGVRAHSAKAGQVVGEVIAHYSAEQVGELSLHRCPPFRLRMGTTNSP